jgi:pantothenate kinase
MAVVGLDIGGTLCKLAVLVDVRNLDHVADLQSLVVSESSNLQFSCSLGTIGFYHFPSSDILSFMDTAVQKKLVDKFSLRVATGGGAFKYSDDLVSKFRVSLTKFDEMSSLLKGLDFLFQHVPNECFSVSKGVSQSVTMKYPFLLVNIGTGVSILRVDSAQSFERVSGSAIGGGTFLGFCQVLLSNSKLTFEEAMDLASKGDYKTVDTLVSDIYGGDYKEINLKGSTIASSLGKACRLTPNPQECKIGNNKDLASSVLHMVAANTGQLALMTAKTLKLERIVFAGNFLRHNETSRNFLSKSIQHWSNETMQALFLTHEGFCGSLGALLLGLSL